MRKLDPEELQYFSILITELKKINRDFRIQNKEINPYSFISICENLENAISKSKMELSIPLIRD